MSDKPTLQFLGATGTVTGSKFVITTPHARVMIDCGLYQGFKDLRERNWGVLPVDPATIDAVVLTHAHLDHTGYFPLLVRRGFAGVAYCTPETGALARIVLPDSGRLQEEEAGYATRAGYSKHTPALPLYTEADAVASLDRLERVGFGARTEIAHGVHVTLHPAGHILGSATVLVEADGRSVLFSGDLGRSVHPLLEAPTPPVRADAYVVESTYGDRTHQDSDWVEQFAQAINRTADRDGIVVIPAFAVDRTEILLFHLRAMMSDGRIQKMPVFADSPMALAALDVYRKAIAQGSAEVRDPLEGTDPFDTGTLVEAHSVDQSKALNLVRPPAIIISASGMATGGRVLHHLAARLPDRRNTILLPGHQVEGTRGRALADGATSVKLLGQYVPVRADVVTLPGLSAHADHTEVLAWLRASGVGSAPAYIVHGEPKGAEAMRGHIAGIGWTAATPKYQEKVLI